MNRFDQKWQTLAAQARRVEPREDSAPFGFAARLEGLALDRKPAWEDLWGRFALRLLAGALPVLLLLTLLEARHLHGPAPLEPGVENTVAQLVWRL